jgi:hypothetical protein
MSEELGLYKKEADGWYDGIEIVLGYMEQRVTLNLKMLVGRRSARELYMIGLYNLAKGWLHTLKKLNQPVDIQAIMTCARSLLEITADLILLYKDPSRQTVRKMLHFDRHQKFKMAAALVKYYEMLGVPVPDQYEPLETFYKQKKHQVAKKKGELWPGVKNLQRWSGSGLLQDLQEADKKLSHAIKEELNMSLEDFHETEYRRLHWYVHGSGLSGYWNMPAHTFNIICAMGFHWSCNFAMLCVKIILTEFKMNTVMVDIEGEWKKVWLARTTTFLEQNPHRHSEGTPEALKIAKEMLGFESGVRPEAEDTENRVSPKAGEDDCD